MVELDRWADAVAGWRKVKIDAARCLPKRSPRSHCDACAAVCPEGAIDLGAALTVKDCSACGLCAASCRADAITLDNPSDEQLVQRFVAHSRKAPRLSLTCMAGPAGPEQVGCLGRLTPELLLAAAACGFSEIELVAGPCGACQYATGREMIEAAIAATATVLHEGRLRLIEAPAWKPGAVKQPGAGVQAPVYEERRAFLLSAFGLLRDLIPLAPARPAQHQPKAPQLSRRREALRWALGQLGVENHGTLPWGETGLRLTGRCLHCGVCQRLCPNSAIKVADGAGLQLDTQRCHTCGLCADVCPVATLSLADPYRLSSVAGGAPVALGEVAAYACARCGQTVTATGVGAPLCLPCTIRSSHHQEVIGL